MNYSITYIGGSRPLTGASFRGLFEAARAEAKAAVEAGECERVEVRNEEGAVCYQHPRCRPHS